MGHASRPPIKKTRRAMTVVALTLVVAFLVGAVALVAISPGRLSHLRDGGGRVIQDSISERVMLEIGGVPQGMFIQSIDPTNPVLLFLHGGPGMPEFFLNSTHPTGLERHFTVVWWEQRGAGMSYSSNIAPDSMTIDQLIADTIDVADYLRARFDQDKVILLGHSWGSYLGIQVAAAAPDRFTAYVGMGQLVHQLHSEVLAHAYMIGAYRTRGDMAMVERLKAAPVSIEDGLSPAYMRLRDAAMHGLGIGTTRDMTSVITGIFLPVWHLGAYTITEKINIWRGKAWSRRLLWDDMLATNLSTRFTHFDLPVYFFIGRYDYTTNQNLARSYFDKINAPVKGFYIFEQSAHGPLFEEPIRAIEILLRDVATGSSPKPSAK